MARRRDELTKARTALGAAALILMGVAIGDSSLAIEQRSAAVIMALGILAFLSRRDR